MKRILLAILIICLIPTNMVAVINVQAGATDVFIPMMLRNELTALPEAGVTSAEAGLTMSYYREDAGSDVDGSCCGGIGAGTLGSHNDWTIILVDNTYQIGMVQLCFPDLAFAAGADWVVLYLHANDFDESILVQLETVTAKLPTNYIMGSSSATDKDDEIDAILVDTGTTLDTVVDAVLVDTGELQTDLTNGGRLDLILDDILLDTAAMDTAAELQALLTIGTGRLPTDANMISWFQGVHNDVNDIEADTAAYDTDAEYATAIWDALIASYATADTFGELMQMIDANTATSFPVID